MAEKILIVDDELDMLAGLEHNLKQEGYDVVTASNGKDGLARAAESAPDIILLDVMMPGLNGYEVCAALRKRGFRTPILMLTAKDSEEEKVRGLETGADDYVVKPFSTKELIARIRAVRRRYAGAKERVREFSFGGIRVDFERRTITRKGKTEELSSCEADLFRLLVAMQGEPVSREKILTDVWGYEFAPDTRTIDNHIVKLRQKIEADPHHPKHILTVHGRGYKFVQ